MTICRYWCPNGCGLSVYIDTYHKKPKKWKCERCNDRFSYNKLYPLNKNKMANVKPYKIYNPKCQKKKRLYLKLIPC